MNSYEKLNRAAVASGFEAFADVYTGDELERYAVYTIDTSDSEFFLNNNVVIVSDDVQLNIYLPINENFFDIVKTVRDNLIAEGFDPPLISFVPDPSERFRHISFSTSIKYEV